MDRIALLAHGLREAEKAHAAYEKQTFPIKKLEWPEFYAGWLFDNMDTWTHVCTDGKCEYHNHG